MELILIILLIFDIYIYIRNKKLFNRNIKPNNKILFYKLQKNYLNNCDSEDIKDLICFLYQYLMNRKDKKESRNKDESKE